MYALSHGSLSHSALKYQSHSILYTVLGWRKEKREGNTSCSCCIDSCLVVVHAVVEAWLVSQITGLEENGQATIC